MENDGEENASVSLFHSPAAIFCILILCFILFLLEFREEFLSRRNNEIRSRRGMTKGKESLVERSARIRVEERGRKEERGGASREDIGGIASSKKERDNSW